jgi:hypothetical protein
MGRTYRCMGEMQSAYQILVGKSEGKEDVGINGKVI